MLSGRRLDLLDPSPLDIEIEDIAHGLARVARWNGQTRGEHAFSVAQHSLIVEATAQFADENPRWRLAALLHDGPEYVIGDMISPFKTIVGGDYGLVEERLQRAIHLRFGLPATLPPAVLKAIKSADRLSAFHEATRLAGFSTEEAGAFFGRPADGAVSPTSLEPKPAEIVGRLFLARFRDLDASITAAAPASGNS
jgi:hypothetical protein